MAGLEFVVAKPAADDTSALSPPASWRHDQAFGFGAALMTGLVGGLMGGLVGRVYGGALVGGLLTGFVVGLAFGLGSADTWPTSLAFAQLAWRWHTSVRLMRFLEDARERGVLRTVGPVCQFRHARLQDRLAEQAQTATSSERQSVGTAA